MVLLTLLEGVTIFRLKILDQSVDVLVLIVVRLDSGLGGRGGLASRGLSLLIKTAMFDIGIEGGSRSSLLVIRHCW